MNMHRTRDKVSCAGMVKSATTASQSPLEMNMIGVQHSRRNSGAWVAFIHATAQVLIP